MIRNVILGVFMALLSINVFATEYHVSKKGNDKNDGSEKKPFLTIAAAVKVAQPGDVITVHAGTYRERINPLRGGESDEKRIVYQAAEGEEVIIKGSEVIKKWEKEKNGIWRATIPATFFGDYNPYRDLIDGDWFKPEGRIHHTGEVYLNGTSLYEEVCIDKLETKKLTWYTVSENRQTFIWANFGDKDPNKELVEINVRPACFYPEKPGINYITVKGFTMRQAATQWAAPTAEQIGLIGTHWSKGWIIEDNIVSDSKCSGISLGKDRASGHNLGDWTAPGYVVVLEKAWEMGSWTKEKIGHHVVRNNEIYDCGQTGIVGSMGCVFSKIINNHIYNIHIKHPFSGLELAGIKFHGPVDVLIKDNVVHDCKGGKTKGIWIDWMAQGTRVTGNLCYNNYLDLLFEANHGPFVVDNNILLSNTSARSASDGGLYAHNLIAGKFFHRVVGRLTPILKPHSTERVGMAKFPDADHRLYNNIILDSEGAQKFNDKRNTIFTGGNVYFEGAEVLRGDTNAVELGDYDMKINVEEKEDGVYLTINYPKEILKQKNKVVKTSMLGKTIKSKSEYQDYDGSALEINQDYLGNKRSAKNPIAGPFEKLKAGENTIKVWAK